MRDEIENANHIGKLYSWTKVYNIHCIPEITRIAACWKNQNDALQFFWNWHDSWVISFAELISFRRHPHLRHCVCYHVPMTRDKERQKEGRER